MLSFTTKIGDYFTIHWAPIVVIFGVILIGIIESVLQERAIMKRFNEEKTDAKFIKMCQERIKTCEKSPAGRRRTYQFRILLCATYLNDGNEAKALEELNALRQQEYEHLRWLHRLFIQYFSGIKYQQINAQYQQKRKDGVDAEVAIRELIRASVPVDTFEKKQEQFCGQLHNELVINAFGAFLSIVRGE